jgi:hypothetical protein
LNSAASHFQDFSSTTRNLQPRIYNNLQQHHTIATTTMADPFTLRLNFSSLLGALNPCEADSGGTDEAVHLALKHRNGMDEDFHAVILEQLRHRDNNINVRANIVYFLEDLVEASRREEKKRNNGRTASYVLMIERDWKQVVDAAIPVDDEKGLGVVNANAVRYVMQVLHFEHGLWGGGVNGSYGHMLVEGQRGEGKFAELKQYVEKRVEEARPPMAEPVGEEDEEPDMSWIHGEPVKMDVERPSVLGKHDVAEVSRKEETARTAALHDIPSPKGSNPPSPNGMDIDFESTPRPPTPPSNTNGTAYSPTRVYTPTDGADVAAKSKTFARQASPSSYTPVQKEDSVVFLHENFDLISQRIEQDRERQRRKEDNSGFIKRGDIDEEMSHIMMTGRRYLGGQNEEDWWQDETNVWKEGIVFS